MHEVIKEIKLNWIGSISQNEYSNSNTFWNFYLIITHDSSIAISKIL